jgi:hypothetical protein
MPRKFPGWARRRIRADRRAAAKAKERADIVAQIRKEAEENGATLAHDGEGGLDPKLALEVFRRDEWTCQNEDCPTPKEDLDLDHIAGHEQEIEEDKDASADEDLQEGVELGHVDDPDALHVLCKKCHDAAHERERAIEDDEEPEPMRGKAG